MTDKVKGDLLAVYKRLGGQKFLLAYATAHPDEFVKHLMRLIPVPREDAPPDGTPLAPIGSLEFVQVARRIAFILASADVAMPADVQMVEMAPAPEPALFPLRPEDPPLSPHEPPVAEPEPIGPFIGDHRGSADEQRRSRAAPDVIDKRRRSVVDILDEQQRARDLL